MFNGNFINFDSLVIGLFGLIFLVSLGWIARRVGARRAPRAFAIVSLFLVVLALMWPRMRPNSAWAQNGPTGGNAVAPVQQFPAGVSNGCSGSGTLASGTLQLTADCLKAGAQIGCNQQPAAPATPGTVAVNCVPTSAVTGSPAATHTVVIFNASTANATPAVNWWLISQP